MVVFSLKDLVSDAHGFSQPLFAPTCTTSSSIHAHNCVQPHSGMGTAAHMCRVCSRRKIPAERYIGADGAGGCGTGAKMSVCPPPPPPTPCPDTVTIIVPRVQFSTSLIPQREQHGEGVGSWNAWMVTQSCVWLPCGCKCACMHVCVCVFFFFQHTMSSFVFCSSSQTYRHTCRHR